MEKKQEYIAPAVLDELLLEMEGQILVTSEELIVDENFDEVKTMGQDIGGDISADWQHKWE